MYAVTSTNLSSGARTGKQVALSATVAIAGAAYFAACIIALHFIRPDLNPISQPTSAYAVGPYSFVMTSAFFSMSVTTLALVFGLYKAVPRQALSRTGLAFLTLWAVGVLIAMIFPMDAQGAPRTLAGTIHQTAGPLTFLSLSVALILTSWRFKHDENIRPLHGAALILSLVFLAAFVATFLSFITGSGLLGLTQRTALATAVTWMILTATCLRSIARGSIAA